jgi:non-specific serine/threonine protein kinase
VIEGRLSMVADIALLVEMPSTAAPDCIERTLRSAIGLACQGAHGAVDVIVSHINRQRMLLILDNVEPVTSPCSLILSLLRRCPNVRLLATSPGPFGCEHERTIEIRGLPVPDDAATLTVGELAAVPAVALFVERARLAAPNFTLTPDNAGLVADICRSLCGLPLALELAAPWLRLLTPRDLVSRLRLHEAAVPT